jgi:adenine C2-methylase RlmN of 23S rRNA A2503 and tRNA A37
MKHRLRILKKKEVKNQILIANTIELEDKRRREKNIVIYGLPVSNGSSEEEIKKIEREGVSLIM